MIPSAAAYYAQAIENMKALPEPANTTYRVRIVTTGARFSILNDKEKRRLGVEWELGRSGDPQDFAATYHAGDHAVFLNLDSTWSKMPSPIFNPTWSGVADWIRFGAFGNAHYDATPSPMETSSPDAAPTIATVRAFGVAYYDVRDAGSQMCANGHAGHAVHLIAHEAPKDHPLTHAVVDTSNNQICEVEFGFRQTGPISATGQMTLNIALVGGTPLVTSERVVFNAHALGIQLKRIVSDVAYSDIAFPTMLPEASSAP